TSVIQPPPGSVDITALAGSAIDASAERTPAAASVQEGPAPIRHRVAQGETAFTISRLYNVSVKSLAEWNGLGPDLEVRTGQVLLVPVPDSTLAPTAAATTATAVAAPGAGSQTPTPPSSTQPLPKPEEAAAPIEEPSDPVSGSATEASDTAALLLPVQGNIIKAFRKGTNDGIDIEAPAGAPVAAADSGTVAAITRDVNNIPILVLRHDDGLLTVYDGIDDISVKKGDSVRRGQQIAKVRAGNPSFLHFETRQGFDSVDPMEFLN
ncbi:MAG: M23 family metallopeptidase, partial [Pseudomonadota bacterium]